MIKLTAAYMEDFLELMKMGKITISQENIFDDIMIESNMCEDT